jgi:6-phosphofructokinase 1
VRLAVLTSGGDSPGMNAAVRAAARVCAAQGVALVGVERGYSGLLEGRFQPLTRPQGDGRHAPVRETELAANLGGSFLGTARCKAFYEPEGRARAAEALKAFDGLLVIGGNGSLTGAHALHEEHGVHVVGVPGSIDHDIGCTSTAVGVDTALNSIVEMCDRISDTARAHRRAFVVEVMGRHSGYLCMAGAVAAGADAALFREQQRSEGEVVAEVAELIRRSFTRDRDKQRVLVLKAEGVEIPCTKLVREVNVLLADDLDGGALDGVSIRATVLGHLVRGGAPSFRDRLIASRLAFAGTQALLAGQSDVMTAWLPQGDGGQRTVDYNVRLFGLGEVLEETRRLLDGTSAVGQQRLELMAKGAGVLAL